LHWHFFRGLVSALKIIIELIDVNYPVSTYILTYLLNSDIQGQTIKAKMDLSEWIIELGGGYRVFEQFDVLLVGRYYIMDLGATASSIAGQQTGAKTQNWGDLFVGGRYRQVFGGKWLVSLRGDVGMGGSDFAWYANADLGYQFSELFSLGLGYRVLSLNYETGTGADYYKYDVTTDGLGLGFRFSF
jgi:hypothetical protein